MFDLMYVVGLVAGSPWFIWKMITAGKYRAGLGERLGGVARREGTKKCVWVHGVSVGEVLTGRTLIEEFRRRHPEWEVVISTTTNTGHAVARKTYPEHHVIYYPLDFSFAVKRTLGRVRPDLIVLVEADLWPNFLWETRKRGIPVVLVNNRITEKSQRRQRWMGGVARGMYESIVRITAQTELHARRLKELGVPEEKVTVVGSLKYDSAAGEAQDAAGLAREMGLVKGETVLVAGSTFDPEEKVVLEAYGRLRGRYPGLRLVLVPRHKERFEEVARLVERCGFRVVRRSVGTRSTSLAARSGSALSAEGREADGEAVILGDTMGELTRFYGLADVVFVGKSLVEGGGQNILEPAALGKAVVFGPSVFNFQEAAEALLGREAAVQVKDAAELERVLGELAGDPERVRRLGEAGRRTVEVGRGATQRNADIIDKVLVEKHGG